MKLSPKLAVIILLIFFVSAFFIFQGLISSKLSDTVQESLSKAARLAHLKISSRSISFDFLRGLCIEGFSIERQPESPVFQARQVIIRPYFLPLILKKFIINKVYLNGLNLTIRPGDETETNFLDILYLIFGQFPKDSARILQVSPFGLNTIIKNSEITFYPISQPDKPWSFFINAQLSLANLYSIKSEGEVLVRHQLGSLAPVSKLFPNRELNQPLKYSLNAHLRQKDIYLSNAVLEIDFERIFIQGLIKDYRTKSPSINIGLTSRSFSLEAISSLKADLSLGGPIGFSCRLAGRIPDLKFNVKTTLFGCRLIYYDEKLNIKNIIGRLEFSNDNLDIKDLFLIINNYPFAVNLSIRSFRNPDLTLKVVPKAKLFSGIKSPSCIEASLSGSRDIEKRSFLGNLRLKTVLSDDTDSLIEELSVNSNDVNFYAYDGTEPDTHYTKFRIAGLLFNSVPIKGENLSPRRLEFSQLRGRFLLRENNLNLKDLSLEGYGGNFSSDLKLQFIKMPPAFFILLKSRDIDVVKLASDLSLPRRISGRLNGEALLDTSSSEVIQGSFDIKEGRITNILILDALADFMRLPALKMIDFDSFRTDFKISGNGAKSYNFKLSHQDINLDSSLNVDKDNNIKGTLYTGISEGVLRQSGQFRRLLNMLDNQTPFIDFRFNIAGPLEAPRFFWLKDEFKQGLERILSKGRQQILEDSINNMVDELFQQEKEQ